MNSTEKAESKFDHWCLVELMGHQTVAGRVTEENLFGAAMMRVDIPATANGRPGYTKWYGPSSIYAITPVEEDVARALANIYDVRPVDEWRLRSLLPEPERGYPADEREREHLMSEEYGSDDDRQDADETLPERHQFGDMADF